MPYSYQTFTGGAAGINLAVSIPFLLRAHVSLYTNYDQSLGTYSALLVEGTNYNWVSDASITMLTVTTGASITLKRKTPTTGLLVGWTDGSNVDMDDLLTADRQNLYAVQEQDDASSLALTNSVAALSQITGALMYGPIGTVAAIPATPTNEQRIEISDSTGIQSFTPLTGKPSGFVGAINLAVRLVYSTGLSAWQWVDYRPTDPDGRYGTIASVTAASTAATAAQATANSATTAAATAQTAAAAAQTTANSAGTAAAAAQAAANTAQARADRAPFLETVKSATGTSVDFTGIPSWVKRVTVSFANLSLTGTAHVLFQLGASSGIESTGYVGTCNYLQGGTTSGSISSTVGIIAFGLSPVNAITGSVVFTKLTGNLWVATGLFNYANNAGITGFIAGDKTLSGTLDRIRITNSGTDTFDAGSVNIMYE